MACEGPSEKREEERPQGGADLPGGQAQRCATGLAEQREAPLGVEREAGQEREEDSMGFGLPKNGKIRCRVLRGSTI